MPHESLYALLFRQFAAARCSRTLILSAALFGLADPASAGLVSTSGDITPIEPPASVSPQALTSTTTAWLFQERSSFPLPGAIDVNVSLPGTSPIATGKNFSPTQLAPGTVVESYFVHVNIPADHEGIVVLTGSLTFDREILGIAVGDGTLNPSDTLLGHPGTAYPTPPNGFRGWEFGFGDGAAPNTIDQITLSADRKTIDFVSRCNGLDQFRVITVVPEPASWTLMVIAGAAIFACRRFRSRR